MSYLDSISLDDIGNCIIEAFTDEGDKHYLIIRTVLGVSRIFQIGPLQIGARTFCSCYFHQMDYDDHKVDKLIGKFVNGKNVFTQISVKDIKSKEDMLEITNDLPNLKEYLYD